MTDSLVSSVSSALPQTDRARSKFYWVMSALLLCVALVGFGRSFYLRPLFSAGQPGLALSVLLHGILMTAWFVLLLAQASLVATGNRRLHCRLGIAGVVLGAGILIANSFVTWRLFLVAAADGADFNDAGVLDFASQFFWGNMVGMILVAVLVILAIAYRKHHEAHKRFMLFASIILVSPAFDRIAQWPLFSDTGFQVDILVALFHWGGLLLLVAAVVVNDLARQRRLHPATLLASFAIGISAPTTGIVAGSEFGLAVVQRLAALASMT
jgi:hypothetical protein